MFFIITVDGVDLPFKLPARIAECEKILLGMLSSRVRSETRKKIPAQAVRTTWKILADAVESQMAMIELGNVKITEVFLSYLWNAKTNQTAFEALEQKGFKALLPAGEK